MCHWKGIFVCANVEKRADNQHRIRKICLLNKPTSMEFPLQTNKTKLFPKLKVAGCKNVVGDDGIQKRLSKKSQQKAFGKTEEEATVSKKELELGS